MGSFCGFICYKKDPSSRKVQGNTESGLSSATMSQIWKTSRKWMILPFLSWPLDPSLNLLQLLWVQIDHHCRLLSPQQDHVFVGYFNSRRLWGWSCQIQANLLVLIICWSSLCADSQPTLYLFVRQGVVWSGNTGPQVQTSFLPLPGW